MGWTAPATATLHTTQVAPRLQVFETRLRQQTAHRGSLIVAVLKQQPATGLQLGWSAGDDPRDVIEPIRTRSQRLRRLVAQRLQMRIVAGNIGRVGDDDMESFGHAIEPEPLLKMHVELQTRGVVAGHLQGLSTALDSSELKVGAGMLQSQGDRPASCAKVKHRGALHGKRGKHFQCPFNQGFRLWSGYQYAGVHQQVQSKEFLVTGDVGQWFTGSAALHTFVEPGLRRWRHGIKIVCQQPGALTGRFAQRVQQEQLRVELRHTSGLCLTDDLCDGEQFEVRPMLQKQELLALVSRASKDI